MSRERWRELDEQATPGPWLIGWTAPNGTTHRSREDDDHELFSSTAGVNIAGNYDYEEGGIIEPADTEFIAAARTAWPAAERECDQLRALLRQVRNLIRIFDINKALDLIDASRLLDDEGQQR